MNKNTQRTQYKVHNTHR